MSAAEELKRRFTKAIKESIKPPILIGPKWFRHNPSGNPAYFQFLGTAKVAKATGKDVHRVAKMLLSQVELGDLDMTAKVTADGIINISSSKPKAGKKKKPAEGLQTAKPDDLETSDPGSSPPAPPK